MLKRISVSLFLGANLCTIMLMWLCVALTFVSPDIIPRLSLLTLAFPVFLAVDLLFVIFWLLFKARLVWVPIAGALLIGGYILDYCPIHFGNNEDSPPDSARTTTITTFNVGYMTTDEQRNELIRFLSTTNADIVCLQEISKSFFTSRKEWLDSINYHILQTSNVAILTHFPILSDTLHIDYPTRSNHSFACWIDCNGDSLLVVNNHLESNHLSKEEQDEYTSTIIDPNREAIKSSSRKLMGKLSEAAAYRGIQADSICALIRRNARHSVIACGDFNETPVSYVYQRFAKCLTSAYREAGNGPGFTYTRRSFPVHIDHLFFSDDWQCTSCRIDRTVSSSDHYPLIVRLSKKERQTPL
ncbi:MAG: endonuclease/exonuclease/phosphatase family protein [Bacteroidaceae bacterium]|nr:endonuclease/exonuclease/phosphatase family protein [Bacteroidaceae bacterium]